MKSERNKEIEITDYTGRKEEKRKERIKERKKEKRTIILS